MRPQAPRQGAVSCVHRQLHFGLHCVNNRRDSDKLSRQRTSQPRTPDHRYKLGKIEQAWALFANQREALWRVAITPRRPPEREQGGGVCPRLRGRPPANCPMATKMRSAPNGV
ncbi:hypothetical protein CO2235_170184 [Cupriavidus oxalaticus]|uniref:Uncharacterized protein n=1 Tax=Cupriavidus oxalaticus TaxID=96344 RepID=A0A976BBF9_9BURK|nr:hypothetical protein CO2235_170184 [Cupriavidus oxalaticus]